MAECFKHSFETIRLGLFDLGGVLYHANYFALFEEIRECFLVKHGVPYPGLAAKGQHLAIREASQSFLKPIRYGQKICAELEASQIKSSSFTFSYKLLDAETNSCLHTANSKHVFVSGAEAEQTFKIERLPDALSKALKSIEVPEGETEG